MDTMVRIGGGLEMEYPSKRELDGVYYLIERNGVLDRICFSDLTHAEQERIIDDLDAEARKRLCLILSHCLRDMGDMLDVVKEG